jgi:DNA (cytosine-5)-methyltransferase 1
MAGPSPNADYAGRYRPRLLDLFCGAGGAAMGYHWAGFDVVGVDIVPQPHYPFEFHQDDAMTFPLGGFDAIHASPPCQDHCSMAALAGRHDTGWMLGATIDRLRPLTVPWVVENVVGPTVTMDGWWFVLCGSSFGLDVRRHRRFGSNLLMLAPGCRHDSQTPRFRSLDYHQTRRQRLASVVTVHGHLNYAGEAEIRNKAMGIDWMTVPELSQAIPPAYTEWIGQHLSPNGSSGSR